LPPDLAQHRYPKTKAAAEAGALALIGFLKNSSEPVMAATDKVRVGAWLEKFTFLEGNPRAARNIAKSRPYSVNSIIRYEELFRLYVKEDPSAKLLMQEVDETDALKFISRLAMKNMERIDCRHKKLVGTDTFEKIVKFIRMAFTEYQKNPSQVAQPVPVHRAPEKYPEGFPERSHRG
jgi:hypothetical protein